MSHTGKPHKPKPVFVPTTSDLTPLSCEPAAGYNITVCDDCKRELTHEEATGKVLNCPGNNTIV